MPITRSTRGSAVEVDGVDLVVRSFTRDAAVAAAEAGKLVVEYAEKAADLMRSTVPVDQGNVLDSITADQRPTVDANGVYAEAGPDLEANNQAFVAYWLEDGTAVMAPRPFVGPAADQVLPAFERAIRGLVG